MTNSPLPERMLVPLNRYIEHGIQPGGFLQAVIDNDLREAAGLAEGNDLLFLTDCVRHLYANAPINTWGSPFIVLEWVRLKRLRRENIVSEGETKAPTEGAKE